MTRWLRAHLELIRSGLPALVVLLLVLMVGLAVRGQQEATNAKFQRRAAAQQLALVEGCERLNIERARENRNWLSAFQILSHFQVDDLPRYARTLTWTPPTDCSHAVNISGALYRSPEPIRFADRLPPPLALRTK